MKKLLLLPIMGSLLLATNLDNIMLNLNNKNYDKAITLLKQQKETKQIDFLLGEAYYKRHLTYTDYKLAMKYLKKAKTPKSYYYIAKMYENGLGVKKDINEAIRYYKLSNTKEAKYELAKYYLEGKYLLKDPKIAIKLLKESAKEGCTKAQYLLGKLYLDDTILPQNFKEAAKWLYLAAQNGDDKAKALWNKYKLWRFQ